MYADQLTLSQHCLRVHRSCTCSPKPGTGWLTWPVCPAGGTPASSALRQRHGWQQRPSRGAPELVHCTHSKAAPRGGMYLQLQVGPVLLRSGVHLGPICTY